MIEPAGPISPFHLLAASLASCTALAVESWSNAVAVDVASAEMVLRVTSVC